MNKNNTLIFLLMIFMIPLMVSCQQEDESVLYTRADYKFPYDIGSPEGKWKLPKQLVEISGLSYIDNERLACIQDEKGNIYIFNYRLGEVETKYDFWESGDYEGIALIGDHAWVVKSNGILFRVKHYAHPEEMKVKGYKTPLSKKNEVEGLTFDPVSQTLLLACKGYPYLDADDGESYKSVFSFDIESKSLIEDPIIVIELDTLKNIKNFNTMGRLGLELLSTIDESRGDLTFQPSGIAVHPQSGNIYIIGAVGNVIVVVNRDSEILAVVELKSSEFIQPEGICFSPDGDLFLANEGKDKKGTIHQFKQK